MSAAHGQAAARVGGRIVLRLAALACVGVAIALAARDARDGRCGAPIGACRSVDAPPCGTVLGDWRIARSRTAGLPLDRSHSACVREPGVISVVPQPFEVSGDTLVARTPAAHRDAQRATVRLDVVDSLPDHWAFAVAGTFLDVDAAHGCDALAITLPVNAGYALIGGNWESRPHGFYFERLADACVYDGKSPACGGEHGFVPHEFRADESFVLDLTLRARDGEHWLEAEITAVSPTSEGSARESRTSLGKMRQRVDAPCWLAPGDPGSALVVVIPPPDPTTTRPGSRVDVSAFAWRDPEEVR